MLEVDEEGVVAGRFGDVDDFAAGDYLDAESSADFVFGDEAKEVVGADILA